MSINIIYILAGDRVKRLRAYFEHYVRETNRQVIQWESHIKKLPPADQKVHADAVLRRQRATKSFQQLAQSLLGSAQEIWPNAAQRFETIGLGIDYRTLYSRMSAETHADAEETLRYFVGKTQSNPTLFEAMALETVMFSRFLLYNGIILFIKACGAYAIAFCFSDILPQLTEALDKVNTRLLDIAPHVGAGV